MSHSYTTPGVFVLHIHRDVNTDLKKKLQLNLNLKHEHMQKMIHQRDNLKINHERELISCRIM